MPISIVLLTLKSIGSGMRNQNLLNDTAILYFCIGGKSCFPIIDTIIKVLFHIDLNP